MYLFKRLVIIAAPRFSPEPCTWNQFGREFFQGIARGRMLCQDLKSERNRGGERVDFIHHWICTITPKPRHTKPLRHTTRNTYGHKLYINFIWFISLSCVAIKYFMLFSCTILFDFFHFYDTFTSLHLGKYRCIRFYKKKPLELKSCHFVSFWTH